MNKNTNAANLDTVLKVRCLKAELQDWKKEARRTKNSQGKRMKLSEWVRAGLNDRAERSRMFQRAAEVFGIKDQKPPKQP